MRAAVTVIGFIGTALLAGCGKIGPNGPDQSLGGFYDISITPSGAAAENSGFALIAENGSGWFVDSDGGAVYFVDSVRDGNLLNGVYRGYASTVFSNGEPVVTGELTGTIEERSTVTGTALSSLGTAPFLWQYRATAYETPASFVVLAGNYQYNVGSIDVTISIDGNGAVTGTDSDGCVLNGQFSIPDRGKNAYQLAATNQCPGAPLQTFTGLATYLNQDGATPARILAGYHDGANYWALVTGQRL